MPLSRASSASKRERARAYNKALPLTIRCLTWNVGNAKPVAAELAHALPDGLDEDIIVVGTQENSYKAGKGGRKRAVAQEKRAVAQESPEPTENGQPKAASLCGYPSLFTEPTMLPIASSAQ
mmetsp:Transcript_28322/g.83507  ORF Transcript_28322/g.83507 Transcript_28322/m.83507 type:complete len:122 (-) Transcript_28322:114-479(-)